MLGQKIMDFVESQVVMRSLNGNHDYVYIDNEEMSIFHLINYSGFQISLDCTFNSSNSSNRVVSFMIINELTQDKEADGFLGWLKLKLKDFDFEESLLYINVKLNNERDEENMIVFLKDFYNEVS